MAQLQLPVFPAGVKEINQQIAVHCQDGQVVYVHGHLPVFQHEAGNLKTFRFFTSQMVANGTARSSEIAEAFGVPLGTVKRYVALYRERGAEGFFETRKRKRSETKLTVEVKQQARELLEQGVGVAEVGRQLKVLRPRCTKRSRVSGWNLKKNGSREPGTGPDQERAERDRQSGADGVRDHAQPGARGGRDG